MDNRHIPYLNAIIAADIHGRAKLTLTMLIDSMDFDTRQTYIGQKALAKKMGTSYEAAKNGIDLLEKLKLIEFLGMRQIHPGTGEATQVFQILLKPVQVVNEVEGKLPGGLGVNHPVRGKLPDNHIQSNGGSDNRGVVRVTNGVERTHTYTDALAHGNTERTGTDQNPALSDDEIEALGQVWSYASGAPDPNYPASLRSYSGGLSSQRLALLMWWGFGLSKYWAVKAGNWKVLDMENFLRASRTIDQQIRKFRGLPKWEKQFPRAASVLDWFIEEGERRLARQTPKPKSGQKNGDLSDYVKEGEPQYVEEDAAPLTGLGVEIKELMNKMSDPNSDFKFDE